MNKKKIILTAGVLLLVTGLLAIANNFHWLGLNSSDNKTELPDAKEELRKLYAVYNRPDTSLNIKGVIKLYDRENKDALKEKTPFSYSKKGIQQYSQLGYVQTFINDSLLVQLDTLNKYIIVSKTGAGSIPQSGQTILPFEKFVQDTSTFKIELTVTEKNKERVLTIKSDLNPGIRSSAIYYDPATYKISKAEIEWWKEAMVYENEDTDKKTWLTVMEYSYPVLSEIPVVEKIKKIIIIKDGKVEPAPAYKEYQFQVTF
jgi:hypothetical protein